MGMNLSSVGIEPRHRLKAMNVFDAFGEEVAGKETRWPGVDEKNWLYADFDSGNPSNDLFGSLLGRKDLGLGADEGLPTKGDSGGPAFIGNKIVGIISGGGEIFGQGTDVNTRADSSFGESAVFMRVSSYASWIDEAMRHPVNNILPQSPVPQTKSAVASNGVHENGNAQMVFQIPDGGHVDILGTTQAVNLDLSRQYFDYLLELAIPQSTPDPVLLDVRDGIYRSLVTANEALKAQGKTDAFAELLVLNGAHGQHRIVGSSKTDHFAILSGDASDTIVTSAVEAVTALGAGHFKTETPAIIAGDNSDQVIEGSAGNDILAGGGGTDTLIGGGGADIFVFNKRGNYRIEDFGREDKLAFYFNSIKTLQDLASHVTYVTELNNGFTIGFDNTMTITVVGINFKDLTPDMVQFHV